MPANHDPLPSQPSPGARAKGLPVPALSAGGLRRRTAEAEAPPRFHLSRPAGRGGAGSPHPSSPDLTRSRPLTKTQAEDLLDWMEACGHPPCEACSADEDGFVIGFHRQ